MDAIRVLLKIARQEADTRRAGLAAALRATDAALRARAAQEAAMEREREGFALLPDAWRDWAGWAARAEARQRALEEALRLARLREDEARDAVREALAALKRLELVQEGKEREQRAAERRREEARAEEAELRRPRAPGRPALPAAHPGPARF